MNKPSIFQTRKERERQRKREGVMLAIPAGDGKTFAEHTRMIAQAIDLNSDPTCDFWFKWLIMSKRRPIEYARNSMVKSFLATSCNRLFMVDSDTYPDENWGAILQVDADIVAGMYLQYDEDIETGIGLKLLAYRLNEEKTGWDTILPKAGDPPIDIDAAGTGLMVIKRRVFEDPRMLLDPHYRDWKGVEHNLDDEKERPDWAPAFFPCLHKPNGALQMTEDLPFCQRAKDLGYSVKLCQNVLFGHEKSVNLLDIAKLVAARAKDCVERNTLEPESYETQLEAARAKLARVLAKEEHA